jgi:uncharacterized linocin/CFP29 family protein
MNHLLRDLAPISESTWQVLDQEARDRLTPALAARRLVDFTGPRGWEHSATNLGRSEALGSVRFEGVSGRRRSVLPLVELRVAFEVSREELRDADRGADDIDLGALDQAAHRMAVAENAAVFHGLEGAIGGIAQRSPYDPVSLGEAGDGYPRAVAGAVDALLRNGVAGPYGLALGGDEYRYVMAAAESGGALLREHLRTIVEGPIVWAPGLEGALVVSQRGGDFVFEAGQDVAIGYESHDAEVVRLYLEQSFSFHVATPEAAAVLTAPARAAQGRR